MLNIKLSIILWTNPNFGFVLYFYANFINLSIKDMPVSKIFMGPLFISDRGQWFQRLSLMCFEMSTFFVGGIQDAIQLAAQLALVNLANVICSFSMGLSNTVVSVISNQIGQSRPLAVQNTIIYACCLIVVIYTTLTVLFLI